MEILNFFSSVLSGFDSFPLSYLLGGMFLLYGFVSLISSFSRG